MNETSSKRNPWAAAALSLLSTGLGHVYCGRIVRGLTLFCVVLLFAPLAFGLALLPSATPILVVLILVALSLIGLIVFAVVDSWRVARATGEAFVPRDYNSPIVYLFLGLVGMLYPMLAVAYLRDHVFEAYMVPTNSMVPTILEGDRVLANKVRRETSPPERGDVIIFRVPGKPGHTWIKRVIGLSGDRVAVRGGDVFVNGKKLERERVPESHLAALGDQARGQVYTETLGGRRYRIQLGSVEEKVPDFAEKTVPDGNYFVLGDNRDNSLDSRSFGFVPHGDLVGWAAYVYLPAESWSRFGVVRE